MEVDTKIRRPVMRYHGGKWKLAPWVMSFFPQHKIYVEPFGGAASVLIRKPRSFGEIYNDREGEVVNVFRILRDPKNAAKLCRMIELTPFSRDEFVQTYTQAKDPIERARNMITRAYMGFGSASMTRSHQTGFRSNSNRAGTTPAQDWRNYPSHIPDFIERLQGVVIENRAAGEIIAQHDSMDTLHYIDPPYVWETRSSKRNSRHAYKFELTNNDHAELSEQLHSVKGMVVLSGYPCALYDKELYADWERHERKHFADGAKARVEVVWLNQAAAERAHNRNHELFIKEENHGN